MATISINLRSAVFFLLLLVSCSSREAFISIDQNIVDHESPAKKFKLKHTKIYLEPLWSSKTVSGIATLDLEPLCYSQRDLCLDAKQMDIRTVEVLEPIVPYRYHYDSSSLMISFGREIQPKENLKIRIDYVAHPERIQKKYGRAIADDKGVFFIESDSLAGVPEHIWTQGETQSSSCWFPTIDRPNQKMTQELVLKVDSCYKTISNGQLVERKYMGSKREDFWKLDQPHAPYLSMFFVGDFSVVKDSAFAGVEGRRLDISYVTDSAHIDGARYIFRHTPEMISFFSDILNYPFPWFKYDQLVVSDFISGAMENTSASIFYDGLNIEASDSIDNDQDDIIAHELFHQWFGDLVTCEAWSELSLNESFATYGEYLWREFKYSRDDADRLLERYHQEYLHLKSDDWEPMINYYYSDKNKMFDLHRYQKGANILHMIRGAVGEEAFFATLRLYLKKHAFSTVEVDDFRLCLEEITGLDWRVFFQEWFFNPGHPELDIKTYSSDRGDSLFLHVVQVGAVYKKLPFQIIIHSQGKVVRKLLWINKKEQDIYIDETAKIDFVEFDPNGYLVGEINILIDGNQKRISVDGISALSRRRALVFVKDKETLIKSLKDDFWENRRIALEQLEECELSEEEIKVLMEMFTLDSNNAVRSAILNVLITHSVSSKSAKLSVFAEQVFNEDPSNMVRSRALMLLSKINKKEAEKLAQANIETKSKELSKGIGEILASSLGCDVKTVEFFKRQISSRQSFDKWGFVYRLASYVRNDDFQSLALLEDLNQYTHQLLIENSNKSFAKYYIAKLIDAQKKQLEVALARTDLLKEEKDLISRSLLIIEKNSTLLKLH